MYSLSGLIRTAMVRDCPYHNYFRTCCQDFVKESEMWYSVIMQHGRQMR